MKLYSVSDEYISFLRESFPRVYSNKENERVHTRKYLGTVMDIGKYHYFIPLSSPKKQDYVFVNGMKTIRKDSLIVIRIVSKKQKDNVVKATLQIGTMIPVPETEIELYDVTNEHDRAYKDLVEEEIIFIRQNHDRIKKTAKILYNKKVCGNTEKIVVNCLDFQSVEKKCDEWVLQ